MFRQFIDRIIECHTKQEAIDNVWYGTEWDEEGHITKLGVDIAYQQDKISIQDHERLLNLINKMA